MTFTEVELLLEHATISLDKIINNYELKSQLRCSIRRNNLSSNTPFVEIFLKFHEHSQRFVLSVFYRDLYPWNFRVVRVQPGGRFHGSLFRSMSFNHTEQVENINRILERTTVAGTELIVNELVDNLGATLGVPVSTSGIINGIFIIADVPRTVASFAPRMENLLNTSHAHLNINFRVDSGWNCYFIYVWDLEIRM